MEESQNATQARPEQPALALRKQQEEEIDLVDLFYLLWGHLVQIIVCVIVGGAAAFAYTYFLVTPLYQATAKVYVVSSSSNSIVNLSDLQLGTQLTADYEELLLSRPLLEDVIDALGLDTSAGELNSSVSIGNPEDTRILTITVTYPEPELAAEIANEIAEQAVVYLPRVMESPAPHVYEEAVTPARKVSPSYTRNTMLAAVVLAAAYCGILVVRYLMDDSFKTPEDLNRYLGIQPLATVPEGNFKEKRKKRKAMSSAADRPGQTGA